MTSQSATGQPGGTKLSSYDSPQVCQHHVAVLVPALHRGVLPALRYARAIAPQPEAVHVAVDPTQLERLQADWRRWSQGVPLVVLDSPEASLLDPIARYVDRLRSEHRDVAITLVVPEFLPHQWWARFLHGRTILALKALLARRPGVALAIVPYCLDCLPEG